MEETRSIEHRELRRVRRLTAVEAEDIAHESLRAPIASDDLRALDVLVVLASGTAAAQRLSILKGEIPFGVFDAESKRPKSVIDAFR
jgi:hypothetical protein